MVLIFKNINSLQVLNSEKPPDEKKKNLSHRRARTTRDGKT